MLTSPSRPLPRRAIPLLAALALVGSWATPAAASLIPGLISDFQSGSTEGWAGGSAPTNVASGGPAGAGDRFLQIRDNFRNFATYNTGVAGILDPAVVAIEVDLMRPASDMGSLDVRLVLFGPGTDERWTSLEAAEIPNDGVWRHYVFSVLEPDLSHVLGSASYTDLTTGLNRIMFRHDPDPPEPDGVPASGSLGIDNVAAVPEPGTALLLGAAALLGAAYRRDRPGAERRAD